MIVIFAISCTNRKNDVLKDKVATKYENWILTSYYDSILKSKSIAKHSNNRISWSTILISISNDSLHTYGTIFPRTDYKKKLNSDTLAIIYGMDEDQYLVLHDSISNLLKVQEVSGTGSNIHSFRKLSSKETKLFSKHGYIDHNNVYTSFYKVFADSLLIGKYEFIDTNQKMEPLLIKNSSELIGFKNFNKYFYHNYFGTLHPYNSNDAITFIDTTQKSHSKKTLTTTEVYSWKFKNDTLTLTEMISDNYERYHNSEKFYKLIKIE